MKITEIGIVLSYASRKKRPYFCRYQYSNHAQTSLILSVFLLIRHPALLAKALFLGCPPPAFVSSFVRLARYCY